MQNPILQNLSSPANSPFNIVSNIKTLMSKGFTPQGAKDIINQKVQSGEITQAELEDKMRQAQNIVNMFR